MFKRILKALKLMVLLKEYCIVSGVGMSYYQPHQFLKVKKLQGPYPIAVSEQWLATTV